MSKDVKIIQTAQVTPSFLAHLGESRVNVFMVQDRISVSDHERQVDEENYFTDLMRTIDPPKIGNVIFKMCKWAKENFATEDQAAQFLSISKRQLRHSLSKGGLCNPTRLIGSGDEGT